MIELPVDEKEIEIINRANGNNVIAVPCWSDTLNSAYIVDNWGEEIWKDWWTRYHDLGGKYHKGETWPSDVVTTTAAPEPTPSETTTTTPAE